MSLKANHFGSIDNVVLEDYNEDYPFLFEKEKSCLVKIFSESSIKIHHIGSTAIPGIKSKPVIDIAITTQFFPIDDTKIKLLSENQYLYWDANPEPNHQFFFKGLPRTHIIHIYPEQSQTLNAQIFFRDYLIKHTQAAKAYEKLKINLAAEFFNDREKYTEMKTEFINSIMKHLRQNS